jgi:hypothetical protein
MITPEMEMLASPQKILLHLLLKTGTSFQAPTLGALPERR